jgi:nucleotide-binding universal stress UspA family protein
MIKDILLHVDPSDAGMRRLDFALELASLTAARLVGVHVRHSAELAPVYKPSQIARAQALVEDEAKQAAADARQLFHSRTSTSQVQLEWRDLAGNMVDTLAEEARTFDLVILGQYEWEGPPINHPLSLAEALVGRCGRPLLVVPVQPSKLPKSVLVAWDGSREAVRALHDALPLIRSTGATVEIAWFRERHEEEDLDRVRDHLVRHGITVSDLMALNAHGDAPTRLLARLNRGHFDMLVMGAFGHPTWFEFLFGGTTAAVMLKANVPILVSH